MSKLQNKVDKWCKCTLEISYSMSITYHSAIKTTPNKATFGFKDTGKLLELPIQTMIKLQRIISIQLMRSKSPVQTDSMSPKKRSRTKRPSSHDNGTNEVDRRQQKCKKTKENQAEYNRQMAHQTNKVK